MQPLLMSPLHKRIVLVTLLMSANCKEILIHPLLLLPPQRKTTPNSSNLSSKLLPLMNILVSEYHIE